MDDLTKRLVSSLKNKYGEIETSEGVFKIKSTGSSIIVVPLGVVKGGKTVEDLIPEIIEESDPKSLTRIVKRVIDQMSLN